MTCKKMSSCLHAHELHLWHGIVQGPSGLAQKNKQSSKKRKNSHLESTLHHERTQRPKLHTYAIKSQKSHLSTAMDEDAKKKTRYPSAITRVIATFTPCP